MRQDVNEIKKIVDNHPYFLDSIIADMFKMFNFKTLCWQAGAKKQEGYSVPNVIMVLLMLPFMMVTSIGAFYGSRYVGVTDMKKDVFYRLQNMERMPWRPLLYGVAKRFQALANPEKDVAENSAFVVDDTVDSRVGRRIENISRVHDHTFGKTRLGFKHLLVGLFDGTSFIPLDFSIHSEKRLSRSQRKDQFKKDVSRNSHGYKRRKECRVDKITNSLAMLKRALQKGNMAKYVLTDSWFSSKGFIQTVRGLKQGALHVICGIKNDKRNYEYKGKILNSKELRCVLEEEGNARRARKWNTRYFEVVVHYEGVGDIKLYICRFPYQKKWRVFLSTDPSLSFAKMMEIYSVRWTIEVFFREAKQQLRMGKCQSRDFDAQIASMTCVCILYTMLSYYRRVHDYETLGGLFLDVADDICEKNLAERLWELFEELLLTVVKLISESGVLDLTLFTDSPEYQYLKSLFEESFLSKQIRRLDSAC